jgi:hypothetical protein
MKELGRGPVYTERNGGGCVPDPKDVEMIRGDDNEGNMEVLLLLSLLLPLLLLRKMRHHVG